MSAHEYDDPREAAKAVGLSAEEAEEFAAIVARIEAAGSREARAAVVEDAAKAGWDVKLAELPDGSFRIGLALVDNDAEAAENAIYEGSAPGYAKSEIKLEWDAPPSEWSAARKAASQGVSCRLMDYVREHGAGPSTDDLAEWWEEAGFEVEPVESVEGMVEAGAVVRLTMKIKWLGQ